MRRFSAWVLLVGVLLASVVMSPFAPPTERASAQMPPASAAPALFPAPDGRGKWGYVDTNGQTAIAPRYDAADAFSEGLARVVVGNRYGYIDATGAEVIAPRFGDVFSSSQRRFRGEEPRFSEGLALVPVEDKYGYIDRTGTLVTPTFDRGTAFAGGRALVQVRDMWGYIDRTGATVIPPSFALATPFSEGFAPVVRNAQSVSGSATTFDYLDPAGKTAFTVTWDFAAPSNSEAQILQIVGVLVASGGARVSDGLVPTVRGGKWDFADTTGKEVIAPQFDLVQPFSEGLAVAVMGNQWGYIDRTGAFAISPRFSTNSFTFLNGRSDFSGGRASVATVDLSQQRWGYIDRTGAYVIPATYATAAPFTGGLAYVTTPDNAGGAYVDASGTVRYRVTPAAIAPNAPANAVSQQGFIDRTGKMVFTTDADEVQPFSEGLAAAKIGGKWGFLDTAGNIAIPPQFDEQPMQFQGGRARIGIRNPDPRANPQRRYGYIDRTGAWAIPAQYLEAHSFVGGRAAVQTEAPGGSGWGYIATDGTLAIPAIYTGIGNYGGGSDFSEGLVAVRTRTGNVMYLDPTGATVLDLSSAGYTSGGPFRGGLALVQKGERYAFVDKTGAVVLTPRFSGTRDFSGGLATARFSTSTGGDVIGFMDRAGILIVPYQYDDEVVSNDDRAGWLWAVRKGGKWGYLDATGTEVIPRRFDTARAFAEGLAPVEIGRRTICTRRDANSEVCYDGDGVWGYIDATGAYAIPAQFRDAAPFSEGLALVNRKPRRP